MKFKHVFTTLCLAAFLGLGVGVGLKHSEVKKTKADGTTYTLVGSLNGDESWNVSDTSKDLSDGDGDGVYTIDFAMAASTNTLFKIAVDHSWDESYGYGNLLAVKPIVEGTWSYWLNNDTNIGIWSKTAITVTIGFRASDHSIFITDQGKLKTFKDIYFVLPNSGNDKDDDAWATWATPRYHFWATGYSTIWDESPEMNNCSYTYTHGDTTGALYSVNVPSDCGLLVRDNAKTTQTGDLSSVSSVSMFHPYENNGSNSLYGDSTTPIFVDDGAYLRGDWTKSGQSGWNVGGQIALTSSSSSGPFTVTGVNLSAGSAVKAVYMTSGAETWCQFNSVSSNDNDHYPVIEVDDNMGGKNAGVQSNGTYNITVTKNANGKWDYAFEGTANTDLDAAVSFANTFVTTMYSECPYNHSTSSYNDGKTSSTLATAWGQQKAIYLGLDESVQTYLLDKDSNITAITTFFGVYDYVYGHYATVRAVSGADFLIRTPAEVASYSATSLAINNTMNTTVVIVVISSISLIALGGFFFIRKKKEN